MAPRGKSKQPTDQVLNDLSNYAGLPIIGYTTMWRASGIELNHSTFKELLRDQNFEQFAPKMPSEKRALRRAIVAWLKSRAQGVGGAAYLATLDDAPAAGTVVKRNLIRPINQSKSKIASYTIIREDVDLTQFGLEHDTAIRFLLDKVSGDLAVSTNDDTPEEAFANKGLDPLGAQIEAELAPLWAQFRELHTTADVLYSVREIVLGSMSFSLRREGGVYFIPESKRHVVEGLRALFTNLEATCPKGSAFCLTLPQIDLGGARGQLAQAAHAAMEEEIAGMEKYLDDAFVSAEAGSVRPGSIAKQLAVFKAQREKLQAYHELLGMRMNGVAESLDRMTEKAKAVVVKAAEKMAEEEEGGEEGGEQADPQP